VLEFGVLLLFLPEDAGSIELENEAATHLGFLCHYQQVTVKGVSTKYEGDTGTIPYNGDSKDFVTQDSLECFIVPLCTILKSNKNCRSVESVSSSSCLVDNTVTEVLIED
jgi:hypothetical protein